MRLYIDLDLGRFVASPNLSSRLDKVDFKRGDSSEISLGFYRGVSQDLLGGTPQLAFALKAVGEYDSDPVASQNLWTLGSGSNKDYKCSLELNTIELNTLLGSGDGGSG